MSSTNRGGKREVSDYYVTPVEPIITFLRAFSKVETMKGLVTYFDPCAGGDVQNHMSYPVALQEMGVHSQFISTMDIRDDSPANWHHDYLDSVLMFKPTIIITNPPFHIAEDIIRKALREVDYNGYVIMLLRLNFFGSKARKPLWDEYMPKYVFIHNRRMSFTPDGKTDSIEYAHFVWQQGFYPEFSQVKVL